MRQRRNIIELYTWFQYTDQNNYVRCTLCGTELSSTKYNLKRHTERLHQELLTNCNGEIENKKESASENSRTLSSTVVTKDCSDNAVDSSHAEYLSDVDIKVQLNLEKDEKNSIQDEKFKETITNISYLERAVYKDEWDISDEYATYIKPSEIHKNKVICCACKYEVVATKTVIDNHLSSQRHLLNTNQIQKPTVDKEVTVAEIKYTAMVVEQNISFLCAEKLLEGLKGTLTDSNVLHKVNLDRKRISATVHCVLAPAQNTRLAGILKNVEFSISIDESTDISVHSSICIVVRYQDDDRKRTCDSLWDIIPAYRKGCENEKVDAQYVFNAVINTFKEADIPLSNVIAFCSDTCNLMMGRCNSVASRFKELNPDIKIVKCPCHLEHLIARDATIIFPPECLELNNLIYNYISNSSKRMNSWLTLEFKLDVPELIILRPVATRWLSQYASLLRILRRWSALTIYFENEVLESRGESYSNSDKSVEKIFQQLQDPLMYALFLFLEFTLSKLTEVNECLQSERPIVSVSNNPFTDLYLDFLNMYMMEDYVKSKDVSDINPGNEAKFKDLREINIGTKTEQFLIAQRSNNSADDDSEMDFRNMCRTFYIQCCNGIKQRCTLNEKRFFFHPDNVLNSDFHREYPDLEEAFEAFPQIKACQNDNVRRKINNEWNALSTYGFSDDISSEIKNVKHVDDFWYIIKRVRTEGNLLFPNLATFALTVLSIPNSNAAPERVWSMQNIAKTKLRNRLSFATIRAILLAAQYVKDQGGMLKFEPTDYMIERMQILKRCKGKINTKSPLNDSNVSYGNILISESLKRKCDKDEMMFFGKYAKNYSINSINLYSFDQNYDDEVNFDNLDGYPQPNKKQKIIESSVAKNTLLNTEADDQLVDYSTSNNMVDKNSLDNCENILVPLCKPMTFSKHEGHDITFEVVTGAFQTCDKEKCIKIQTKVADYMKIGVTAKEESSNNYLNSDVNEVVSRTIIMENGLISNFQYYTRAKDSQTIGRYKGKDNNPLRNCRIIDCNLKKQPEYEIQLYASEYKTLNDINFISGDVIDAFGAIKEREWINTQVLSTHHSKLLLVDIEKETIDRNWFMFHTKGPFQGKILMPYGSYAHWCLFIVDVDKGTLTHIDPLTRESKQKKAHRAQNCIKNFLKYLRCSKEYTKNNLQEINWKYEPHIDNNRPQQTDGWNCGAFVMHYMDCIGSNRQFQLTFSPDEYRRYISKLLINKSEPMQNICLYCFRKKKQNSLKLTCKECNRFIHWSCLKEENQPNVSEVLLFRCQSCSKT